MPSKKVEFLQEIRRFSDQELSSKIDEIRTKLHKTRVSHSLTPSENPVQFRFIKRDIARILTEIKTRSTNLATKPQKTENGE